MKELHKAQLALHKKICDSYENFKAEGKERMTRVAAQARLDHLE